MKNVNKIFENIYIIDGMDHNKTEKTGIYVLTSKMLTLIDTCSSPSVPYILKGLKELGYSPHDVKYIILTHIHLDHGGGAGLLLQYCPNARVIAHPKGKRHLIDPTKLIHGAKEVYGDSFDSLFNPILPIPEERLYTMENREQLKLSQDCTLTFYDTPGHANHHFSIYHSNSNGMFTGDTAGVHFPTLLSEGIELYLPSTSPNQFDPNKMLQSIVLYEKMKLDTLFFSHFGASHHPTEVYNQIRNWLTIFLNITQKAMTQFQSYEDRYSYIVEQLVQNITGTLLDKGMPPSVNLRDTIIQDIEISTQGLIHFWQKQ